MTGTSTGRAPTRSPAGLALLVRYRLTPWWVRVLVVFVASRVVTTTILLAFAAAQGPNPWGIEHPGYIQFASIWDSNWYYIVGATGYPAQLPLSADGHVAQNQWAFLPGFPVVVQALHVVTGIPFQILGVFVSVGFALATALLLYRLFRMVLPESTALFSVVLYCFAPLSPVLQVTYAESMHMFFITWALYLLLQRRYWMLLPIVAVMSLTRPSGLAFALALALHIVHRWWVRDRDPFPVAERVAAVTATTFSGLMGIAWPLIAWAATGSASAYTDTELAWRSAYIGFVPLVPFQPWFLGAQWWLNWNHWPNADAWGAIFVVLLVALFAASLFTPWVRRLGVDLRFWVASWALYLLAVWFPQSSTFRLLMPMFPLLGAIAAPRSRLYRIAIVALFIAGQVGWVYIAWWFDGVDWTPP